MNKLILVPTVERARQLPALFERRHNFRPFVRFPPNSTRRSHSTLPPFLCEIPSLFPVFEPFRCLVGGLDPGGTVLQSGGQKAPPPFDSWDHYCQLPATRPVLNILLLSDVITNYKPT